MYVCVQEATPVKRLCGTHNIITVNGQLVTRDDARGQRLTSTGARHLAAADGPEYVAQCPVNYGGRYTYRFTIEEQEGTVWWWHAHSSWLRGHPLNTAASYPFPKPNNEFSSGEEWWNADPIRVGSHTKCV